MPLNGQRPGPSNTFTAPWPTYNGPASKSRRYVGIKACNDSGSFRNSGEPPVLLREAERELLFSRRSDETDDRLGPHVPQSPCSVKARSGQAVLSDGRYLRGAVGA